MAGFAMPKYEGESQAERDLTSDYKGETAKLETQLQPRIDERNRIADEFRAMPAAPEVPKTQPIPDFQPRKIEPAEINQFMGLSMAVAALGSRLMRAPIATALNAAGSAMKGFSEGNFAQAKLDMENFNTQLNSIKAKNDEIMRQYDAVLRNRQLNMQQKIQQLSVIHQQNQDDIGFAALKKGDIRFDLDRMDKLRKGMNDWNMGAAKIQADMQNRAAHDATLVQIANMKQAGQGTNLNSDALDDAAAFLILNGRIPTGMARAYGKDTLEAIQQRATEMRQKLGMGSFDFAAAGPITKQKVGALLQFEKNAAAIQSFEKMLVTNVQVAKELSEKVGRTNSPYLNRPLLELKKNLAGDPDVAEYLFQVENVVLPEAARILSNPNLTGPQTDAAREEVRKGMSGAMSPEQINRIMDRIVSDAQNRTKGIDEQKAKLIREIRDPLANVAPGATLTPSTGATMEKVSKSGRPIVSDDGGKTWRYK